MKDEMSKMIATSHELQGKAQELIERLIEVAKPQAVFSEPVTYEGHTVITASEVGVGMGIGFGGGGGQGIETFEEGVEEGAEVEIPENAVGIGMGGGGGGGANARPVAVITLSPDGVQVEPIVDVTKVGLAFFAALGTLFIMIGTARKSKRR